MTFDVYGTCSAINCHGIIEEHLLHLTEIVEETDIQKIKINNTLLMLLTYMTSSLLHPAIFGIQSIVIKLWLLPFSLQHGSTYGGNPLASRVAIEALKVSGGINQCYITILDNIATNIFPIFTFASHFQS